MIYHWLQTRGYIYTRQQSRRDWGFLLLDLVVVCPWLCKLRRYFLCTSRCSHDFIILRNRHTLPCWIFLLIYEILKSETDSGMDQPALILSIMLNMHGPESEAVGNSGQVVGYIFSQLPIIFRHRPEKFCRPGSRSFNLAGFGPC